MANQKKHNIEEFNSLPIDEVNKIKVLSLYDFIVDNKEKIENEKYGVGLISRAFGLKKVEIATYLKPVCSLSQKLRTEEVCDILFNIKERMKDEESKKKKPTSHEVQYSHYLKDDRLKDVVFESKSDDSLDNQPEIKKEIKKEIPKEEEEFESPFESNKVEEKRNTNISNVEDLLEDVDEKKDAFVPLGADVVDDEDELVFNIHDELNHNDVEYSKEESVSFSTDNLSKAKKPVIKKVLFGVGASALIASALYGTFSFILGGSDSNVQSLTLQNTEANTQAVVIPPIETPKEGLKPTLQIQAPNAVNENIPKISIVEERIETNNVQVPIINKQIENNIPTYEEPKIDSNVEAKKTEEIERTLALIMNKLNALEENRNFENKSVSNTSTKTESSPISSPIPVLEFKNVNDFEKEFKKFKFSGKTFEYKGVTVNEGDILGNIRVEYIIPDAQIRVWDIKEGYPFVKIIK